MTVRQTRYTQTSETGDASTSRPLTDTDWTGADMRTVPHESPVARLEAERDAALAAFAHVTTRLMRAAEGDHIESVGYLFAIERALDWLAAEGLEMSDASAARIRVACPGVEFAGVAA